MAVTRKLQRTKKDQYTLTIPKTLVELLNLKEQDELEFGLDGDNIVIKKSKKKRGEKRE